MESERNRRRVCSERGLMESESNQWGCERRNGSSEKGSIESERRKRYSEEGSNDSERRKRPRKCCSSSSSPSGEVCAVDRISDLPVDIISHILSFLPMKSALATSFLSKKWKLYRTKVSTFDFDDEYWVNSRNMDFAEVVKMVLLDHDYEYIHKLRMRREINRSPNLHPYRILNWIGTALSRNVKVLDLDLDMAAEWVWVEEFWLPTALYTSTTLEVLKLRGNFLIEVSDVVVSLPKLSQLELVDVRYESNESLPKLIAGCPVLKDLTAWFRGWMKRVRVCTISSPSLKRLRVCLDEGWKKNGPMRLEIDAPALELLYINDRRPRQISIQNQLTQLDMGHLEVPSSVSDDQIAGLLQAFRHTKTLRLCGDSMTVISNATNILSVSFERLTSLYMYIGTPGWKGLLGFLDCCINLQFMFITHCGECDGIDWMDLVSIPRCLSSSLRFLAIKSFSGSEKEMALLKFILRHGVAMERVYLWFDNYEPRDSKERHGIIKRVSKLPKESAICEVVEWSPKLPKASPICEVVEWNPRRRWTLPLY